MDGEKSQCKGYGVLTFIEPSENSITHGPILGRPGATTMSIWVRTHRPGIIQVIAKKVDGTSTQIIGEAKTILSKDNSGVVTLNNLEPDTRYQYQIKVKGKQDGPTGSFMTWANAALTQNAEYNPEGLFNFSFEFACGNSQSKVRFIDDSIPQRTFETLNRDHAERLDFAILNGDWLYERERTFSMEAWKKQTGVNVVPSELEPIPRIVGI